MKAENTTKIQFDSLSVNEAYARGAAAFLARYDPTVPSWPTSRQPCPRRSPTASSTPTRTASGPVTLYVAVYPGRLVQITVADKGVGIPDIPKAMEPLFTTGNPEERSGWGSP